MESEAPTAEISLADLFPRQVRCHVSRRIEVPAELAWAVVGDIGSTIPGGEMIERVEVEGSGEGAVRTYHLRGGGAVVERIEEYDPSARRYVYRITDFGPFPMARYLGTSEVVPAGPSACILSWVAMADPLDGEQDSLAAILRASVSGAVEAIASHLEGGSTS